MAASKTYRFLTTEMLTNSTSSDSLFEFDESDIYNVSISISPQSRKPLPTSRISKRSSSSNLKRRDVTASSVPVSVPDWSKILKQDYSQNRTRDSDDDDYDEDDGEDTEDRIPPHEFLARTRMASFSVHEGVGRTLKGRDLSRLRNAIFEITGFQD